MSLFRRPAADGVCVCFGYMKHSGEFLVWTDIHAVVRLRATLALHGVVESLGSRVYVLRTLQPWKFNWTRYKSDSYILHSVKNASRSIKAHANDVPRLAALPRYALEATTTRIAMEKNSDKTM